MERSRYAPVILVALLALARVVACAAGPPRTQSSTTTTTAPTSTTTTTSTTLQPSVEDEVRAAYLAYWVAVDRIYAAPDPNVPDLDALAVEPLLSTVRDEIGTLAAQRHAYVVEPGHSNEHRVLSVSITSGVATIADCWVDGTSEVDQTGAIVDGGTSTREMRATAVPIEGDWKLSRITQLSQIDGVAGCAA